MNVMMLKIIENKLKSLQLSETGLKSKEIPNTCELVEEEKKDEEDRLENILDPLSQTCRGRPKKNRIKATCRRSKKKSDHDDNVAMNSASGNQAIYPLQSQVGVITSTQESVISNPCMLQPNMVQSWKMYWPAQQFTNEHSSVRAIGVSPMYGLQHLLSHPPYVDQRNNI